MPRYSASRYGNYTVAVPEYAQNVRLSIGAASGGGSYSSTGGWYWGNGGFGRAGDFRLKTRSTAYSLYFYIGSQGGFGIGPDNPGGSGGSSSIASGGNGHRSGGGGGGASGVYDTGLNRYTIIVGGGGGAGRFGNETGVSGQVSAGRGIGGGATTSTFSGRTGQNAQAGHRGGGGGGSTIGGAGSYGGAQTTNGYAGIGGNSSYYANNTYYDWTINSGYNNYGDGFFTFSFDYAPPTIQYFTMSPSQILLGNNATLSWSTSGTINTVSLFPFSGTQQRTDTITVSPTEDTTYTLSVSGPGGSVSSTQTIDVLIPPIVNLFSDAVDNTIIIGNSVNLNWTIEGDASTAQLSPGVGNVNIGGGPAQVSPTITTTYTLVASHPLAGTGSDQITITVIQPPSVTVNGPDVVDYSDVIIINCEADNATQSLQLLAKYYYLDGTFTDYQLISELDTGSYVNIDVSHIVDYTDNGPTSIEYKLYAIGQGNLTSEDTHIVTVNIDQTPNLIDVPESRDKLISEDPVITPEEDTFLTLTVEDIDIPVRIKSDYPIQVEIDNDGVYRDVEQI